MVLDLMHFPIADWVIRVSGSAKKTTDLSGEHPGGARWDGGLRTRIGKVEERCGVVLYYAPQNAALASLSKLGLANPAEVVWELVPFSFVLDWFLPVGDWLSTLDAAVGYEFLDGCCTQFIRGYQRSVPRLYSEDTRTTWLGDSPVGMARCVGLKRTVYLSSPIPRPPRPDLSLSLGHMANGLALLSQVFKR